MHPHALPPAHPHGGPPGGHPGGHPGGPATPGRFVPRLIAWEMTKRCNLRCAHCRIEEGAAARGGDLTTAEAVRVIDSIAAHYQPILIMTGGDPLLRQDFFELAAHATSRGLRAVLASCGFGVTPASVERLKEVGIRRLSFSLDAATREAHDAFRNEPGAWDAVMTAAGHCKRAGLEFQINTTITRLNRKDMMTVYGIARDLGAIEFHPFFFVPVGRGKGIADLSLDASEYEAVLKEIAAINVAGTPIVMKPTCAPQYARIFRQEHPDGDRRLGGAGCMGGKSFAFISASGRVKICGFLDVTAGQLRECDLDFHRVWTESPLFLDLRDFDRYHGKCGACAYRAACGGCRARAHEVNEDHLGEEPFCDFPGR